MAVKAIPDGFHTVTPYLCVEGVAELIEFMKKAFDAVEIERHPGPGGRIMHAQVRVGTSMIMMGEPTPQFGAIPASMYLYVPNVDEVHKEAVAAGATSVMEVGNQFYGDRSGGVKDKHGNYWWVATHIEDVAPDEMARRAEAAMKGQASA
ncbi:MAG: VOC family protein [Acidimicrobiia bacterium]|nr:VOC family protein [Acidimicrobiia bacterium]